MSGRDSTYIALREASEFRGSYLFLCYILFQHIMLRDYTCKNVTEMPILGVSNTVSEKGEEIKPEIYLLPYAIALLISVRKDVQIQNGFWTHFLLIT